MSLPIRILPFFAVLRRSAAVEVPEGLSEVAAAAKSAGIPDCGNRFVCLGQHPAGGLQTTVFQIFKRRRMQMLLKDTEAFPLAQICRLRQSGNGNFFGIMLVNIGDQKL